jgi:hypothetical protein
MNNVFRTFLFLLVLPVVSPYTLSTPPKSSFGFRLAPARLRSANTKSQTSSFFTLSTNKHLTTPTYSKDMHLYSGFGDAVKSNTTSSKKKKKTPKKKSNMSLQGGGGALRELALKYDEMVKDNDVTLRDVYVLDKDHCDPSDGGNIGTFWFVGKFATRESGDAVAPPDRATVYTHSKNLVLKLRHSRSLSIFTAPGNSEMEVVRNLTPLTPLPNSDTDGGGCEVGFNPEIYIGDEQHKGGLRVKVRAEIARQQRRRSSPYHHTLTTR